METDHAHGNGDAGRRFWTRPRITLVVLGAVAAYFLLSEHRAHFLGALPYLLLLGCPLMHVFMHGGHGHGGGGGHPHGQGTAGGPGNAPPSQARPDAGARRGDPS